MNKKTKITLVILIFLISSPSYSMMYHHTSPPNQNIRYMSPKIYTPTGYDTPIWNGRGQGYLLLESRKNKKTYNVRAIITISKSFHDGFYSIDINTGESDWMYYPSSQSRDLDYNKILRMMNSF